MKQLKVEDVLKNKPSGENVGTISKEELEVLKEKAKVADELQAEVETLKSESETLKEQAGKVEGLEKVVAEVETLKSSLGDNKVEELLKAKEELEELKKAKAVKELEDTVEVVKAFNSFEEAEVEAVATFLNKNKGEAVDLILKAFDKNRETIKNFIEEENGSDLGNPTDTEQADLDKLGSKVMENIRKKYKKED